MAAQRPTSARTSDHVCDRFCFCCTNVFSHCFLTRDANGGRAKASFAEGTAVQAVKESRAHRFWTGAGKTWRTRAFAYDYQLRLFGDKYSHAYATRSACSESAQIIQGRILKKEGRDGCKEKKNWLFRKRSFKTYWERIVFRNNLDVYRYDRIQNLCIKIQINIFSATEPISDVWDFFLITKR